MNKALINTLRASGCRLVLCLAAAHVAAAQSRQPAGLNQLLHRSIVVDGRTRTFLVDIPDKAKKPMPVVFVFHGGGGTARNMVRLGFGTLAQKESFIAVYPQAFQGHWNDGRKASGFQSQRQNVDDVAFVRAILNSLIEEYPVDRSRIFATGVSNGGIFCHLLAARASDVFAAIAPVIGGMAQPLAARFKPEHPISLLVIQGDADPLVPVAGGRVGAGIVDRGRIIGTKEMLGKYLKLNGMDHAPTVTILPDIDTDDGATTTITRYPPSAAGFRLELYMIRNGGHNWPGLGGARAGRITPKTTGDFDATQVIWRFFEACPPRKEW